MIIVAIAAPSFDKGSEAPDGVLLLIAARGNEAQLPNLPDFGLLGYNIADLRVYTRIHIYIYIY